MPELPEVETIKRQLAKTIVGKKVKNVKINLAKMVNLPVAKFKKTVVGAKIEEIKRRAKILIFDLDNNWSVLIHLKLTGQLIFHDDKTEGDPPTKHTHIIYYFTDGTKLYHNDLRQFGWERLIQTIALSEYWQKEKLGPEPLDKDFNLAEFTQILKSRPQAVIKPLLMDQKAIAGIGNIYSDESLFVAKILPTRKASTLKPKEIDKLFQAIKQILIKAITRHGTSVQDYVDSHGQKGNFAPKLFVYNRHGQPCKKCRTKITRLKLRGRSAHYCPQCQK